VRTLLALPAPIHAASPAAPRRRFTAGELAAAGRRADALTLTDPSLTRPAALDWPETEEVDGWRWELGSDPDDAVLDVEDDAPTEEDRLHWAAESGTAWDRRQAQLARSWAGGFRMGNAGCALSVPVFLKDQELADAIATGWASGAAELAEAMPTPAALLDLAERSGWEGDDLLIPAELYDHQAEEYAAAWAEGRAQRRADEEELQQDRYRRGVLVC
jgi:hypothetical protein